MNFPKTQPIFYRHALALALALAIHPLQAVTMNISGACTLVNAINNANSDSDTDGVGGCPAGLGADVLELAAKKTYTLATVNNLVDGANGLPVISSVLTINGNGAAIKRSRVAGTPDFRLFDVSFFGNLTLNNLQVSGGKLTGNTYGGGLLNGGQLTLNHCTISGNSVEKVGGGIASGYKAKLNLNDTTVTGNTANDGGGIINFPVSDATINNSTIADNTASQGSYAGIGNGGTMIINNSTVSNNRSLTDNWGTGGIVNSGTLTLNHTTLSGNSIKTGITEGVQEA